MSASNKRKQLVNELRKAHFPFGFQGTTKMKIFQITKKLNPNTLRNIESMS